MGYDLHITRKEFWSDEEGPRISLEEWVAYVKADLEIVPDPENRGSENYIYLSRSEHWPLWWNERGEIYTTNPPDEVILKLLRIAEALGARVLGDDDEIYNPADPANPLRR